LALNKETLHLTPLGAGDLIDRAIRFYRSNFWTFVWIAAPPILVGTMITVLWTTLSRGLFTTSGYTPADVTFFRALFSGLGSIIIWFIESVAMLMVMGGASRNFVRHLLFDEPVTFAETYRNVRRRFGSLLIGSTLIGFLLSFIGFVLFYFGFVILIVVLVVIFAALYSIPFVGTLISIAVGLALLFGIGWLFFLVASRFAYAPQAMMVEGLGVSAAIGRSVTLAKGNVKRLYALFVFSILATYIAMLLFYIPLGWYAYLNGVEIFSFKPEDTNPLWYPIAVQVISQASLILLAPVWMIGLCLLYVDERVRHEGYDIELMAARELGEIPAVPRQFINPLQPVLQTAPQIGRNPNQPNNQSGKSQITTLGLN
jgi:hypothetical protein